MSLVPKLGPEPTLISRNEVDALYESLDAIQRALATLGVDFVVTGGSLLGAVRQRGILFCDDDIDIAIIDTGKGEYDRVRENLQNHLDASKFQYQIKPWEGGDRIRPKYRNTVFVDLFVLREYSDLKELKKVIGVKVNGQPQSYEYINRIIDTITTASQSHPQTKDMPLFPLWHFNTRKAIEMWPKEVYRPCETFPLESIEFGPLQMFIPRMHAMLLERAFGKDCFEVYYASISHSAAAKSISKDNENGSSELKPLVSAAGQWEGGRKQELTEEKYVPMQPTSRAARRVTDRLHNRESLFEYLREQRLRESKWSTEELRKQRNENYSDRPRRTVYMDGVFDLFHIGHLEAIRQCASLGDRVILGVTGDVDAAGYKRPPILNEIERTETVGALKYVDKVICPCPLIVDEAFMRGNDIDLVVHGFCNDADADRQYEFFEIPMKMGKFQRISYCHGQSTTDIIEKIKNDTDDECEIKIDKPQWFGATLAAATNSAETIPFDPFPMHLRKAIEPHISKASKRRRESLNAVREATGGDKFDAVMKDYRHRYGRENDFNFDPDAYPLRTSLLGCCALDPSFDLSRLHENQTAKDDLLRTFTEGNYDEFQSVYDSFVREVCIPQIVGADHQDIVYYQAFPCLRIVQPGEFSIGPHADISYGHMPCSINCYVPLTPIEGTSALYLESRTGSEDWHPIEGDYGFVKQFAGAINMHWTTENNKTFTRVSLDFRIIPGAYFETIKCGGALLGGQLDVYRAKDGYYSSCSRNSLKWERNGSMPKPDARIGFPWTVKCWDKMMKKREK